MSKLENMKIHIKNAKVKSQYIDKICYYFSKDYTAIQTSKELEFSRQTINHYYKLIRSKIIEKNILFDYKLIVYTLEQNCIEIKHLNIYNHDIFYVENKLGIFILNNQSALPYNLSVFFKEKVENTLTNHKKANSARVLYNKENNSYVVSGFFKSDNKFEVFLQKRLRKFRGINKNNFYTHLNESLFRYNQRNKDIYLETVYCLS